jgi:putative endonuclease
MYSVYILYSEKLNIFYKGHTNDIQARLSRHNNGQEDFTSKGVPWVLITNESGSLSIGIETEKFI